VSSEALWREFEESEELESGAIKEGREKWRNKNGDERVPRTNGR